MRDVTSPCVVSLQCKKEKKVGGENYEVRKQGGWGKISIRNDKDSEWSETNTEIRNEELEVERIERENNIKSIITTTDVSFLLLCKDSRHLRKGSNGTQWRSSSFRERTDIIPFIHYRISQTSQTRCERRWCLNGDRDKDTDQNEQRSLPTYPSVDVVSRTTDPSRKLAWAATA